MLAEIERFVNWVRRRSPAAHTWRDYRCDLEIFCEVVGDRPLGSLTFRDIDHFIAQQSEQGFQPATINRRLAAVISLYNFLVAEDEALVCPVLQKRHHLREPQRLPRPVQEEELKRFFCGHRRQSRSCHVHPHVAVWHAHRRSCKSVSGRSVSR